MTSSDLVAHWEVPLHDKVHKIEFEHGTTTGKRVIRVDGNEILRREWMFKLVGNELFTVDSVGAFSYSYGLKVNGKSYKKFTETQSKALKTWIVHFDNEIYRVVLEKDTLDVWANGKKLDATGEFVDDGTETHFTLGNWPAYIKAATSGNRREGIIHHLIVNENIVPPTQEESTHGIFCLVQMFRLRNTCRQYQRTFWRMPFERLVFCFLANGFVQASFPRSELSSACLHFPAMALSQPTKMPVHVAWAKRLDEVNHIRWSLQIQERWPKPAKVLCVCACMHMHACMSVWLM